MREPSTEINCLPVTGEHKIFEAELVTAVEVLQIVDEFLILVVEEPQHRHANNEVCAGWHPEINESPLEIVICVVVGVFVQYKALHHDCADDISCNH